MDSTTDTEKPYKGMFVVTANGAKPFWLEAGETVRRKSFEEMGAELGIDPDRIYFHESRINREREARAVRTVEHKVPSEFLNQDVHNLGLLVSDGKVWYLLGVPAFYRSRGNHLCQHDGRTIKRIISKGVVRPPKPTPFTHMTGRMVNYTGCQENKRVLVTFREKLQHSPPTALWSPRVIHRYLDFANKVTLFGSLMKFQASSQSCRITTKSRTVIGNARSARIYESQAKTNLSRIFERNRDLPSHDFQDTDLTPYTNAMAVLREVWQGAKQRFARQLPDTAVMEKDKVVFKSVKFFNEHHPPLHPSDILRLEAVGFTVLRKAASTTFATFEQREVPLVDSKGKSLGVVKNYPDGCWELPLLTAATRDEYYNDARLLFQLDGCWWSMWWGTLGCKLAVMPDRDLKPPKDFKSRPWWDSPLVEII